VIYTDKAAWRKPIPDTFWYAFSSKNKKQYCYFDVIKVKSEKNSDLIKKHSLMCKLLALKAGDRDSLHTRHQSAANPHAPGCHVFFQQD